MLTDCFIDDTQTIDFGYPSCAEQLERCGRAYVPGGWIELAKGARVIAREGSVVVVRGELTLTWVSA
jgi:hypothetical protein